MGGVVGMKSCCCGLGIGVVVGGGLEKFDKK